MITRSHRDFLKPSCGKHFSKPLRETQVQHSLPVDTVRKLNVLCTFNLRPLSTG